MADVQMINQLKFRIVSLESNLAEKQKVIDEYKSIETEADSKIKGLNKIHTEKVKSLLNSIQILKKQKASIEGLSKQHKRSKLIEQLNKQILDQDLALEVLRKYVYEKEGKQEGRKICDQVIVTALKKGPERIKPLTRQQLRMEIDKLKEINISLQRKMKQGDFKKKNVNGVNQHDESMSEISSVGSESFVNQSQEMMNKLRQFQLENQNLKLEVNSKMKIIERQKTDIKEKEKFKAQVQLLKNQIEMANRKVFTFQKLMKDSKQNTNKKLIDLYERELKVEELELMSKENSDQLKSASDSHNILLEEMRIEKEELQAKYEALKQENENIILDNISSKKRQEQQKAKIAEIKEIDNKKRSQLGEKLLQYERQVERVISQNQELNKAYEKMRNDLFIQRADWVEQKDKFIKEIEQLRESKATNERNTNFMIEIDNLKTQNDKLKSIVEAGGSGNGGDDRLLLERLENYKRKLQFYESKDKGKDVELYNDLFNKYNSLNEQFAKFKQSGFVSKDAKKGKRKQIIEVNRKENKMYEDMSSGVEGLNLDEVDSAVLQNFDTSYEYSVHVDEFGNLTKMPKVTQADKQLLKLINSDLWYFVNDENQLTQKIEQASQADNENESVQDPFLADKIRKFRNLSHPQGQRISLYEEEIDNLDDISENVSITSAMKEQINAYDSDINIEMKKAGNGAPKNIDYAKMKNMDLDIGSSIDVSSVESGVSNLKKKKVTEKAGKITLNNKYLKFDSQFNSSFDSDMIDSDVSSVGIRQNDLKKIDSDVEVDFRKKKNKK